MSSQESQYQKREIYLEDVVTRISTSKKGNISGGCRHKNLNLIKRIYSTCINEWRVNKNTAYVVLNLSKTEMYLKDVVTGISISKKGDTLYLKPWEGEDRGLRIQYKNVNWVSECVNGGNLPLRHLVCIPPPPLHSDSSFNRDLTRNSITNFGVEYE